MDSSTDKLLKEFPKKLHAAGKPIVPAFKKNELLYRRIEEQDLTPDRKGIEVSAMTAGWPKLSFNRSGYSRPEDVRYPRDENGRCGAAAAPCEAIPTGHREPGLAGIHLSLTHAPEPWNYSHAEIVMTVETGATPLDGGGKPLPPMRVKQPDNAAFTKLRMKLCDAFEVVLEPSQPSMASNELPPTGCRPDALLRSLIQRRD